MQKLHHYLKNFTLSTPHAIVLGSLIIACGLVSYGFIVRGGSASAATTLFAGKAIDAGDFVEGNTKSDVVVIEYSDPECPFCVQLHPTLKQLRTEYASKIGFVYRHFPLTSIHPHAFDEARAIACAGILGGTQKYYEYIDALFGYKVDRQTTALPATGKEDIASGVGIDKTQFLGCMNSGTPAEVVNASTNDGVNAGVEGTPSSFVLVKTRKGYEVVAMIDGARPYAYIKAAIDEALSR
jgi:protein-disulfide isomerase